MIPLFVIVYKVVIYIDCHAALCGSKPKKKQLQLQRTINISCHDHIKICYFTAYAIAKEYQL